MLRSERHWSTHEGNGALTRWADFLNAEIPMDVSSTAKAQFSASVQQWDLGPFNVTTALVGQHVSQRSRQQVAQTRQHFYEVIYLRHGSMQLNHYGHVVTLSTGDSVIVDTAEPYQLSWSANADHVVFHIPQGWLKTIVVSPEDAVAQPFVPATLRGRAMAAVLNAVSHSCEHRLLVADALLVDQVGGALAAAITPLAHGETTYRRKLRLRVQETLRELHADSELNAAQVARLNGISVRYLHSIFAAVATTFGDELLQIRLTSAAELLSAQRGESKVIDVAVQCGFVNASHFARRFRERFGLSPTQYGLRPA